MEDFLGRLRIDGYALLPVTVDHFLLAGSFPVAHQDPFDRLIAAQAKLEDMPLLSADPAFDQFPIEGVC